MAAVGSDFPRPASDGTAASAPPPVEMALAQVHRRRAKGAQLIARLQWERENELMQRATDREEGEPEEAAAVNAVDANGGGGRRGGGGGERRGSGGGGGCGGDGIESLGVGGRGSRHQRWRSHLPEQFTSCSNPTPLVPPSPSPRMKHPPHSFWLVQPPPQMQPQMLPQMQSPSLLHLHAFPHSHSYSPHTQPPDPYLARSFSHSQSQAHLQLSSAAAVAQPLHARWGSTSARANWAVYSEPEAAAAATAAAAAAAAAAASATTPRAAAASITPGSFLDQNRQGGPSGPKRPANAPRHSRSHSAAPEQMLMDLQRSRVGSKPASSETWLVQQQQQQQEEEEEEAGKHQQEALKSQRSMQQRSWRSGSDVLVIEVPPADGSGARQVTAEPEASAEADASGAKPYSGLVHDGYDKFCQVSDSDVDELLPSQVVGYVHDEDSASSSTASDVAAAAAAIAAVPRVGSQSRSRSISNSRHRRRSKSMSHGEGRGTKDRAASYGSSGDWGDCLLPEGAALPEAAAATTAWIPLEDELFYGTRQEPRVRRESHQQKQQQQQQQRKQQQQQQQQKQKQQEQQQQHHHHHRHLHHRHQRLSQHAKPTLADVSSEDDKSNADPCSDATLSCSNGGSSNSDSSEAPASEKLPQSTLAQTYSPVSKFGPKSTPAEAFSRTAGTGADTKLSAEEWLEVLEEVLVKLKGPGPSQVPAHNSKSHGPQGRPLSNANPHGSSSGSASFGKGGKSGKETRPMHPRRVPSSRTVRSFSDDDSQPEVEGSAQATRKQPGGGLRGPGRVVSSRTAKSDASQGHMVGRQSQRQPHNLHVRKSSTDDAVESEVEPRSAAAAVAAAAAEAAAAAQHGNHRGEKLIRRADCDPIAKERSSSFARVSAKHAHSSSHSSSSIGQQVARSRLSASTESEDEPSQLETVPAKRSSRLLQSPATGVAPFSHQHGKSKGLPSTTYQKVARSLSEDGGCNLEPRRQQDRVPQPMASSGSGPGESCVTLSNTCSGKVSKTYGPSSASRARGSPSGLSRTSPRPISSGRSRASPSGGRRPKLPEAQPARSKGLGDSDSIRGRRSQVPEEEGDMTLDSPHDPQRRQRPGKHVRRVSDLLLLRTRSRGKERIIGKAASKVLLSSSQAPADFCPAAGLKGEQQDVSKDDLDEGFVRTSRRLLATVTSLLERPSRGSRRVPKAS